MKQFPVIFDVFSTIEFIFLLCIFYVYFHSKQKDKFHRSIYLWAYLTRVLATPFYLLYHKYIQKIGDMFGYHDDSVLLTQIAYKHPLTYLKLLISPSSNAVYDNIDLVQHITLIDKDEAIVSKVGSIINFFTNDSILNTSFFFSVFAFLGCWKLYLVFERLYPDYKKPLSVAILFIPSVIFWGTSISKDSICIGALGFLFSSFYHLFIFKENRLKNLFSFAFFVFVFLNVKLYILLAIMPALSLFLLFDFISKIKNRLIRFSILPIILVVTIFASSALINIIGKSFEQYSLDAIPEVIANNYKYLSKDAGAGSSYDIGKLEPNLNSMLAKFPVVTNLVFFRPYPWEIKNFGMALAGIESFIYLILTLFVIFKVGIFYFLKKILTNKTVLICLLFSIFFAFLVGLSSGNYGSLMRIKIPMLPFYFSALVIIYYDKKANLKKHQKTNASTEV